MADPIINIYNIDGENGENIFEEAIKYFRTQDYSLINQIRPNMLIFERGSRHGGAFKTAYTKLTINIGSEKDKIIIRCEHHLPYHFITLGSKKELIKEAESFYNYLLTRTNK